MSAHGPECFTDFALQEYAQGRLDSAVRRDVADHTQDCPACREALQAFTTEATLLHEALKSTAATNDDVPQIPIETLALYSSGALAPEETARVESVLSRHPGTLQQLLRLARETEAVCSDEAVHIPAQRQPSGEILRMPKRMARPFTVTLSRRVQGGQGS